MQYSSSDNVDAMTSRANQLSIINEFASSLIRIVDLDELYDYVTHQVVKRLGFDECSIFIADFESQLLNQVSSIHKDNHSESDELSIPINEGICGYVLKTGCAEIISDVSKDPRYLQISGNVHSEICVPLVYDGQVLGVIDCEHPERGYYTKEHLSILTTVASMLSAKIDQCKTVTYLTDTINQLHHVQQLEKGMLQIANLSSDSQTMDMFYKGLHDIVNTLLPAENLFIGYYNKQTRGLEIPYIIEHGVESITLKRFSNAQIQKTASVYAINSQQALLLSGEQYQKHIDDGNFHLIGALPNSWLGVPFDLNDELAGIVVVQSYNQSVCYTEHDKNLLTYISQQIRLVINRVFAEQALQHKVLHDELTGIANRALLIDRLTFAINSLSRAETQKIHALLYLDFDRFKIINDTLGHQVGDKFLVQICGIINSCIRETDTFARLGGDEFAILLCDIFGAEDVNPVIERIKLALKEPILIDDHLLQASTSIGVAFANKETDEAYKILQRADAAMYQAKSLGRGKVQFFNDTMRQKLKGAALLESDIQNGMLKNEFTLFYQPIFTIQSGNIVAFEALVRWHHPERGFISPADFIPLAEETGQILALDLHILELAAKQIKIWQGSLPEDFKVTVNVSSKHFSTLEFADFIQRLYYEYQLPLGSLCIEITESGLIENLSLATEIIDKLKACGVKLCLDDFGTGYSALGYLHQLPIHILKIDKSFIDNLSSGESHPLVDAILTLANSLDFDVVAEGIETKEQLEVLRQTKCQYGQGFLVAKPMPAKQAYSFLTTGKLN
ncbi:EAL domain-containing protein [Pseudoalteromonas sp.]|uniref:sensor domain-containing phosphodiesterase n=1 Tax=Pseudoalteromonas sp. TaxID=53249 RepID=UPI00356B28E3